MIFFEQHFLKQGENMEHPHSFGTAMGEPHLHEEEAAGQERAKGGGAGCRDHRTLGSERWKAIFARSTLSEFLKIQFLKC